MGAELSQVLVVSAGGGSVAQLEIRRSQILGVANPAPGTASLPELRWQLRYGGSSLANGTVEDGESSAVVEVPEVDESIDDAGLSLTASTPDGSAAAIAATLRRSYGPVTRAEAFARGIWRGVRQQDAPPALTQSVVANAALEVMPPRSLTDGSARPARQVVVYAAVDGLLAERRRTLARAPHPDPEPAP